MMMHFYQGKEEGKREGGRGRGEEGRERERKRKGQSPPDSCGMLYCVCCSPCMAISE